MYNIGRNNVIKEAYKWMHRVAYVQAFESNQLTLTSHFRGINMGYLGILMLTLIKNLPFSILFGFLCSLSFLFYFDNYFFESTFHYLIMFGVLLSV